MGPMGRHCSKYNAFFAIRWVLQPQFFYSTTAAKSPISSPKQPRFLPSLKDFLVGSLGFSEKQALYASSMLTKWRQSLGVKEVCGFNFSNNAELVISFLEQKGLDKPQIRNLVYSAPQILVSRIQQNLEPKMRFFQDLGLSVSDSADIISAQPRILRHALHSTISPAANALRAIVGSNENVVRVIKGFTLDSWPLVTKNLVTNVSSLRARGIPIESIQKRIVVKSAPFMLKPRVFEDIMAQAEAKWGVSPHSSMFLYAVHALASMSEKSIESKCRVFESYGWTRSQVVDLFRKSPFCLTCSAGNIEAKVRFIMNELGYGPSYILVHTSLLTYSLDNRVLPRHLVVQVLKEKGLVREDLSLYTTLSLTEPQFLKRFILPFRDAAPNLCEKYVESVGSSRQQQGKRGKRTHISRAELKPDSGGNEL